MHNNQNTPLLETPVHKDNELPLQQVGVISTPKKTRALSDTTFTATKHPNYYAVPFAPVIPDVGVGLINESPSQSRRTSILASAKGSQSMAIFMLCSISLGVGVFVLPEILNMTGIGTGVIMLIGFALMSTFTQLISIEIAVLLNSYSYEDLAYKSMGRMGEFLLAFFMMLSLLIGNCAHIQTVGQLLHDIIEWFYTGETDHYKFNWKKTGILYCIMLCLTIPWLFQKNLHGLSGVGTLSVCVVLITAVSLIISCLYQMIIEDDYAKGSNAPDYGFGAIFDADFWSTDFWRAAPTFAFVFTGLLELFPVFNEINNRNSNQAKPAITISTSICLFIYVTVGVIVVITFGEDVKANSLYNINADNYWVTFCCFALVIVITLLYPVINYPMINAIETILDMMNCCKQLQTQQSQSQQIEYHKKCPTSCFELRHWAVYNRRNIISIIGIVIVICIDISVTDLVDLFGLCGSVGLSFICYIFPCLIYLIVKWKELHWLSWKFWTALIILLFSTAIMIYSTVVIISNLVS